ncbi:transcription factor EGL1-like [Sesamum indicum]|uniref:Transcription factor EGL1-like n=1 Tax=Sesamum indicum TaxID=4182 RepID=A0A6I9STS8_SESIN|nr:transcription factor EGL1-like [Sesamum indicum]
MDTGNQSQKGVLENLRKQLALAVRSIQWSYAIFWSISAKQPGALEWGCGYYNGDIKTRKTVQAVDVNADQMGLQRSDQLRELYESLSLGETSPQPKRPTAALSPEDLTDAEWYFLVCMSFVFNIGQGLPGQTLTRNETVWLRNAHRADTKVFSRSLLAKSASIQTVVCFPHLGGVIELGTTELVSEDLNLIQHIKTSFLGSPSAVVPKIPDDGSNGTSDNNDICEVLDHANVPEDNLDQLLDCQEMDVCSPDNSSDDFPENLLRDESHLVDGVDGEAPPMQNRQFKNDSMSNNSMNSSDCVSQTYGNPETSIRPSDGKAADSHTHGLQKFNQQKNDSSGFQGNDIHYQVVLSSLLKSSHQLVLGPYCRNRNRESSFLNWKDRLVSSRVPQTATPQRLLKKVLFEVARMHENCRLESGKQNSKKDDVSRPDADEIDRNHVLSERKRREKLNERFMILGSLVPSGGKVDKVSILDHTIEYLKELERKVEELESTRQSKPHDAVERTSDNYGPNKNKRKACETDKMAAESKRARLRDSSTDSITVSIADKDVLIEMRCSWRECVLLEVMEAVTKLHLDSQTVQSSNIDGILSVSIKAKCKGLKGASAGLIRQALQKVIRK